MKIILIGPMGVGKTTIGRLLAKELHYEFLDSDLVIQSRAGADIPWIFDVEGEKGFRDRETNVIKDILQKENCVIATGGGAVLKEENRQLFKEKGQVVFLNANLSQLLYRTSKDKKRPLLQTENPRETLAKIIEQRTPLYHECADLKVSTSGNNPKNVIRIITKFLTDIPDN